MDFEDDEVDAILQVAVAGHLIGHEMLSEELGREVERWNARMVMFSKDRDFANRRTAMILDEATHPDIIKIESRLTKYQFKSLARWLEENATVSDSKYATLNTKLMLFLHICGHDASFRSTGTRFWMPWSQISKYFHQVLEGLVQLAQEAIQGYDINDSPSVPTKIYADKKYHTFWNCLGAVDGTLIPASIKGGDRLRDGGEGAYRCRKGWLALNVLGCVDFDMNFKYVYPGWEGSAHDATVFNDAVRRGEFVTPKGRFWLADAGYSQADGYGGQLLAPYIGERYHLAEWERGNKRPRTKEELFNLRHSKMRNVVERTYGVWKMRFHIFQGPRDGFSLETQIDLIFALSAVHNFINDHGGDPKAEWEALVALGLSGSSKEHRVWQKVVQQQEDSRLKQLDSGERAPRAVDGRKMKEQRDAMAQAMWDQYLIELEARGLRVEDAESDDDEDVIF